jgi:hypothetical protein
MGSSAVGQPGLSRRARNGGLRKTDDYPRGERHRGQGRVRGTAQPRAARLLQGASDGKRAVRLARRVAPSIRRWAGISANEQGDSRRRERLGCPAHAGVDRRRLERPARLSQADHGPRPWSGTGQPFRARGFVWATWSSCGGPHRSPWHPSRRWPAPGRSHHRARHRPRTFRVQAATPHLAPDATPRTSLRAG